MSRFIVRLLATIALLFGIGVGVNSAAHASDFVPLGWGSNGEKQISTSQDTSFPSPRQVPTPGETAGQTIVGMDAHAWHGCAVTEEGELFCWGNNAFGQLGRATQQRQEGSGRPVGLGVSVGLPVQDVATGEWHTCALTDAGEVYCWGRNTHGQLGNDNPDDQWRPAKVDGLPADITQISLGDAFSCALASDGRAFCWGHNGNAQLANGSRAASPTPVEISGLPVGVSFTSISAGARHVCGVGSDGVGYCWGMNSAGQAGQPAEQSVIATPTAVAMDPGLTSVSAGQSHTCALTDSAVAVCWGSNRFGQLGDGTQTDMAGPVIVQGDVIGTPLAAVSAGGRHTCATGWDASIFCWGDNSVGQIGDGSKDPRPLSVRTASADTDRSERPAIDVVAARDSSFALYGYAANPGSPLAVALTGTTLSWNPPLYAGVGAGAVSQYRISMLAPGQSRAANFITVPADVTAVDLAGACPPLSLCTSALAVEPGQEYRWTVASVGGTGGASPASRPVAASWVGPYVPPVPKPGSPPSSPFITGLDGTTLSWTFPDSTGFGSAALAQFDIRVSVAGSRSPRSYMIVPANATSADLAGPCPIGGVCARRLGPLVSGVGYEFRVYAIGANGAASSWPRRVQSSYFVWP